MKFSTSFGLIFFFACFLACSDNQNTPSVQTETKSLLELKIDSIGLGYIQENRTKGFSIAVVKGKDTLYNRGFGYIDSLNSIKTSNDHLFLLASISKLMTATLVMKLVEEGKLSLNQTLHELLPDFPNQSQAKKIKLYHLLSHTSGLMDYAIEIDSIYLETGINPTEKDYFNFFGVHELLFEPGTFYSYTNSGFLLAKMIIEKVTGNSLQSEINRVINNPIDLELTLIAEAIENPKLSTYFELVDTAIVSRKHWSWISGDGGLTSTAIKLATFPLNWSNGNVLSNESFKKMCAPIELESGVKTGYGLGVRNGTFTNETIVGHTGGDLSAYAVMMFFPEKELTVVVFDNTNNSSTSALHIIGDVALAALGKEKPEIKKLQDQHSDISPYIGIYEQYGYKDRKAVVYEIFKNEEDGHLYRKRIRSESKGQKLFYLGNHEFAYESYPLDRIKFELDEKGNPMAYKVYYNGLFMRMGFRKIEN